MLIAVVPDSEPVPPTTPKVPALTIVNPVTLNSTMNYFGLGAGTFTGGISGAGGISVLGSPLSRSGRRPS